MKPKNAPIDEAAGKQARTTKPRPKRPRKPHLKLTATGEKKILDLLKAGAPMGVAAVAGGISVDTLARVRDPQSKYYRADFAEALRNAREIGVGELVGIVRDAAPKDWRAARFLLGVMEPGTYGNRVLVGGDPGGAPVKIDAELRAADAIRGSADASTKIHEAIAAAVGEKT